MKTVWLVCRIVFGLIFIYASFDKILHPAAFADIVANYRLLPEGFSTYVALLLPWLEVVAGIALLIGKMSQGAYIILMALTFMFLVALTSALLRGIDTNCGCFSITGAGASLYWDIARDVGILCIGLAAGNDVFKQNPRLNRRLHAI